MASRQVGGDLDSREEAGLEMIPEEAFDTMGQEGVSQAQGEERLRTWHGASLVQREGDEQNHHKASRRGSQRDMVTGKVWSPCHMLRQARGASTAMST